METLYRTVSHHPIINKATQYRDDVEHVAPSGLPLCHTERRLSALTHSLSIVTTAASIPRRTSPVPSETLECFSYRLLDMSTMVDDPVGEGINENESQNPDSTRPASPASAQVNDQSQIIHPSSIPAQTPDHDSIHVSQDGQGPDLDHDTQLGGHEETEYYMPWLGDLNKPWLSGPDFGILTPVYLAMTVFILGLMSMGALRLGQLPAWVANVILRCTSLGPGLFGLLLVYGTLLAAHSPGRKIYGFADGRKVPGFVSWVALILGAVSFGIFTWLYYKRVQYFDEMPGYVPIPNAWLTGLLPHSYRGCQARVEPQQSLLFTGDIYMTQFHRLVELAANQTNLAPIFNETLSRSIRADQKLCYQGFGGNQDLYGMGIRTGIYLQWIASLLANNLLPASRKELQKIYLIFSISISITTYVLSFTAACIFGIEIEVLYWLYWGGFLCVFASAPSQTRLGRRVQWVSLDWSTAIQYITHTLMFYHAIWFMWYAYDQVFSRMPCGTYQFFFARVLDPSPTYTFLRDYLTMLISPIALPLGLVLPITIFVAASEIKNSIRGSDTFQMFFSRSIGPDRDDSNNTASHTIIQHSLLSRVLQRLIRLYGIVRSVHHILRRTLGLPSHGRRGIRLITPVDIKDRRNYRIRCAALGLASFVMSISAVEATLSWNKVVGIYSITSVGQFVPLVMALGSLINLCWQLVKQEGRRQQDLRRRRILSQDIELEPMPATLAGAVQHAFAQPDAGFLTSGGVLPLPSTADVRDHALGNDYLVSGALSSASHVQDDAPGLSAGQQRLSDTISQAVATS